MSPASSPLPRGRGPHPKKAARAALRARVFGASREAALPRRMAASGFRVRPAVAWDEMFCLVVLEAMAAGRPVITTAVPTGVREVNVPGETGLEVPVHDVRSLAEALDGGTGGDAGRFSCPRCGAALFGRYSDEIDVNLGCLDAPDHFMPTYESWIIRREAWLPPFPLARHYDHDREGSGRTEG